MTVRRLLARRPDMKPTIDAIMQAYTENMKPGIHDMKNFENIDDKYTPAPMPGQQGTTYWGDEWITIPDQGREFVTPPPALISAANGSFGDSGRAIENIQQTLSQPGSLRIHANWFDVDTGMFPLDDDNVANILVQQQKNDSENHDSMIDSNPIPGSCPSTMSAIIDDPNE